MGMPVIGARIKNHDRRAVCRINRRKVRPFEEVASFTCQRKVVSYRSATMLTRPDMVDLKTGPGDGSREAAILAAVLRTLPHFRIQRNGSYHQESIPWRCKARCALE